MVTVAHYDSPEALSRVCHRLVSIVEKAPGYSQPLTCPGVGLYSPLSLKTESLPELNMTIILL